MANEAQLAAIPAGNGRRGATPGHSSSSIGARRPSRPPKTGNRPLSNDSIDAWVEVERFRTLGEADQHGLVLVAAGIDCQIVPRPAGVGLLVAASQAARAERELAAYARDNRPSIQPTFTARPLSEGFAGAFAYCGALLFIHAATNRHAFSRDWLSAGEAQAGLIVSGQWWRVVTALGLHADYGHLLANAVAAGLLGLFLAQLLGSGLAWFTILLAGGAGNALNAVIQPSAHTAIGASTSVFGALAILAVLMLRYQASLWRPGLRRWLPLAAGVMVLAFLGIEGERIDVGAHIAGFIAGCLIGVGIIVLGPRIAQRSKIQIICWAATAALFVGAWLLALGAGA